MQENFKGHSNGHIDIYRDYETFYRQMTDKADRIHNAISLVMKYVSHKDTVARLESIGIDFLEMSYMLHPTFGSEHKDIASQMSFTLKELKTITAGIVIRGILNPESKQLFDRELDNFLNSVHEYIDRFTKMLEEKDRGIISPLFDTDFFGGELKPQFSLSNPPLAPLPAPVGTGQSQTPAVTSQPLKDMSVKKKPAPVSQGQTDIKDISQGQPKEKKKADVVDRLNRKSSILSFIKQNKEAQIKDILTYIGNCSEKTIQRELNELIKDGVLKKEGDRRWSKYSLLKDIR